MHRCCAIACKNVGIHLFPRDTEVRKKWEIAVCRKNFKASKHSRLCSDHFKSEDYIIEGFQSGLKLNRHRLKRGVIPSLYKKGIEDNQIKKTVDRQNETHKSG